MSISVITPSFNQGRFVARTVESVLSQATPGVDYVVFDGGSSDDTVEILRRYGPPIRWVSEPDGGQFDAVNKGVRATSGTIIGWLNSDDIYYPGAIEAVGAVFASHPEADVVYGNAYHIDEHDQVIEPYYTEDWNFERLKDVCYLCQPAVFFRRRLVERIGLLDAKLHYCADYEYWLRAALAGVRFLHIPQYLAGSRLYAETKTLGSRTAVHREINDMMRQRLGRVPDRWIFNYAHAVLDGRRFDRSRKARYVAGLSVLSIGAALRWNKRVSPRMLAMLAQWISGGIQKALREQLSQ